MNRGLLAGFAVLLSLFVIADKSYGWYQSPEARIVGWYKRVCVGQTVNFDAEGSLSAQTGSYDPDNGSPYGGGHGIDQYDWSFPSGASETSSSGGHASCKFNSPGLYNVWVEVTDDDPYPLTSSDYSLVRVVKVDSITSDKDTAVLCENITFTVTTNPTGYGYLISWSGGGSPATGSGSQFTTCWNCTGTKTVTASCGTSDASKNVSITLPGGCYEGTTGGADLTVYETDVIHEIDCLNCSCCGATDYGLGGDGIIEAVYNNCEWVFWVGAQREVRSGPCTNNFIEVDAYYPYLTEDEYCGIVGLFASGGCGGGGHPVIVFANAEAVEAHEDEHVEILEEKLLEQDSLLSTKESMDNMAIDCDLWWTHSCGDAVECREEDIWNDVADAYITAWQAMDAEGEARPEAAARPYNEAVARSLCEHARDEGWEYCEACSQVGVEEW